MAYIVIVRQEMLNLLNVSQKQVLCNQSQNVLLQPSMNFKFPPEICF